MKQTECVQITDIAFGGDGVARLADQRVIFIPFAAMDDELRIRITEEHRSFCRGEIVEILKEGEGRVEPKCPHYRRCAGCCYQHLTYEKQLQAKTRQLQSLLRRIGKLDSDLTIEVFASPKPYFYRNKLKMTALDNQNPTKGFGYFTADNETVLSIEHCPLVHPNISKAYQEWLENPTPASSITFRCGVDERVLSFTTKEAVGNRFVREQVAGKSVDVPLGSFWQVNPAVAELLIAKATDLLKQQPISLFVDAYSGIGTFSLALGNIPDKHVLIEINPESTKYAQEIFKQFGVKAPEVYHGATEKILPRYLKKLGKKSRDVTLLLDPPRTGCEKEALTAVRQSEVAQLLYISCNPATLSRDLQRLGVDQGLWNIESIALFDMFPQTMHFETLVFLSRKRG